MTFCVDTTSILVAILVALLVCVVVATLINQSGND